MVCRSILQSAFIDTGWTVAQLHNQLSLAPTYRMLWDLLPSVFILVNNYLLGFFKGEKLSLHPTYSKEMILKWVTTWNGFILALFTFSTSQISVKWTTVQCDNFDEENVLSANLGLHLELLRAYSWLSSHSWYKLRDKMGYQRWSKLATCKTSAMNYVFGSILAIIFTLSSFRKYYFGE